MQLSFARVRHLALILLLLIFILATLLWVIRPTNNFKVTSRVLEIQLDRQSKNIKFELKYDPSVWILSYVPADYFTSRTSDFIHFGNIKAFHKKTGQNLNFEIDEQELPGAKIRFEGIISGMTDVFKKNQRNDVGLYSQWFKTKDGLTKGLVTLDSTDDQCYEPTLQTSFYSEVRQVTFLVNSSDVILDSLKRTDLSCSGKALSTARESLPNDTWVLVGDLQELLKNFSARL